MNNYTWNPVYNLVMEIKQKYTNKFGNILYDIFEYIDDNYGKKQLTCLEKWVKDLNIQEYINIFEPLQFNQSGTLILIRYGNYSDVFGGENEIANDNFWNLYNGIYNECRSIVIDIKNDIIVLSPFRKFRNLNECEENNIDNIIKKIQTCESLEITDKLDGSMQCARFYNNQIIMSGSQAIDMKLSWRLQDGYNVLTSQNNYIQMIKDNPKYTFIFEYISLNDAHVVNYKKEDEGLYLLGMKNVYTGEQLSYRDVKVYADKYNIKMTKIFDKTFDDVIQDAKKYKSHEKEGYVLNIDGYFIKIKCDDYTEMHKVLSNISSINLIIKSIADNTFDDLISKVPEAYRWRVIKVADIVFDYIKKTDKETKEWFNKAPKDNRKKFMIWVEKNVPKEIISYVKNIYLGKKYNYIKSGNEKSPKYKKLVEMGINNYSNIFIKEE